MKTRLLLALAAFAPLFLPLILANHLRAEEKTVTAAPGDTVSVHVEPGTDKVHGNVFVALESPYVKWAEVKYLPTSEQEIDDLIWALDTLYKYTPYDQRPTQFKNNYITGLGTGVIYSSVGGSGWGTEYTPEPTKDQKIQEEAESLERQAKGKREELRDRLKEREDLVRAFKILEHWRERRKEFASSITGKPDRGTEAKP